MEFAIDRTYLYDKVKAICSEMHDKNTLQSKLNFGDPSLKYQVIKGIFCFRPNSLQEKSAFGCVHISYRRMDVDVRYPRYYPTSLQHKKPITNVYARPTFKQTVFRHARACFQTSLKKSSSTSIRFHCDNCFIF